MSDSNEEFIDEDSDIDQTDESEDSDAFLAKYEITLDSWIVGPKGLYCFFLLCYGKWGEHRLRIVDGPGFFHFSSECTYIYNVPRLTGLSPKIYQPFF